MDAMCGEGEAYCWMGCRALPRGCPSPDLAKCFSEKNNLTCSTEHNGKPMDPTCKWECRRPGTSGGSGHQGVNSVNQNLPPSLQPSS